MKKEYPPVDFINRKKEQEFLLDYFRNVPRNILFLYGPKSTGKTTLIKKVLDQLDAEAFAVSYFNMRETSVLNIKDFKRIFFPEKLKEFGKTLLTGINFNLGFFSWDVDEESMLETRLFGLMMDKILKANKEGIKPVIILDEFQYLRGLGMEDKENTPLIHELFKFFIALTKQNNLAHVICLTSDSYYMEELYTDTKLTNTSDFQMIEHLSKEDIYYWLGEKEKCPSEMVDDVWDGLGGSVWEIWQVFVEYKNTGNWRRKLDDLLQIKYSYIADYYDEIVPDEWREKFLEITKGIVADGEYIISRGEKVAVLVKDLVSRDYWFYDTKTKIITANSRSIEKGMERLLGEL
jgi:AAA+ ATPase superfamily predicted ATPase